MNRTARMYEGVKKGMYLRDDTAIPWDDGVIGEDDVDPDEGEVKDLKLKVLKNSDLGVYSLCIKLLLCSILVVVG